VGYSTNQKLNEVGIETVADLIRQAHALPALVGAGNAKKLLATAQGLDVEEDLVKDVATVSAEKNFGLRNLTLEQTRELLLALCESAVGRCPPRAAVERATVKLKMAVEGWQEPSKKGGVGDVFDWSRGASCSKGGPESGAIFDLIAPFLTEVDTSRIRGVGVMLKLKEGNERKRKLESTLDRWFAGETLLSGVEKPLNVSNKMQLSSDQIGGVTDECIVCGTEILLGHLTAHMATHLQQSEVCPCPICFEPIELTDTAHVSNHFPLPRLA
jgi:hypothetical protein